MKISASYLREIIEELIAPSISLRRSSIDEKFLPPDMNDINEPPSEEEVTDFVLSNQLYDQELVEQLSNPGLLGFHSKFGEATDEWISAFREMTEDWANNNSWLGGDEPIWVQIIYGSPDSSELWAPSNELITPSWVDLSPSYFLIAKDLIEKGKHLSELTWRDFENLIGYLLENDGWKVNVTQATKDGGIDVIGIKEDRNIGLIKSIWQAKKYGPKNLVRLNEVRELYAAREESKASKAVIVTTNRLTRDAIKWIRKDEYRFEFRGKKELEDWIRRAIEEKKYDS
ncbi:restriction endonuclease [Rhodohalobacter sp. 614A]|uniref:restriction endonuclease n=1 Tax=Rhodohalobacter sp. 614A TaxID=2908649 RepID=UPI001F4369EB|nr:restriction endonuclease [Rhodohalobacter sp. 614A]